MDIGPISLGGIGAALTGIGNVASAFGLGSGGGLSPRKSAQLQYEYQKHWWRDLPGLAKEAGLSPLVLAGANPGPGVIPQAVGGHRDIGGAATSVGQYLSSREAAAFDAELKHEMLRKARAESDLLESQADAVRVDNANRTRYHVMSSQGRLPKSKPPLWTNEEIPVATRDAVFNTRGGAKLYVRKGEVMNEALQRIQGEAGGVMDDSASLLRDLINEIRGM